MSLSTRPPMRRIIEIDYLLSQRKYPNAPELAREFEVNIRTIYRDIDYMRYQMDAPIDYSQERKGYFYSEEGYSLPIVKLTEGELIAIFLAEKVLRAYSGTPYHVKLESAFRKICRWLPEGVSIDLSIAAESFSFDIGPVRETELEVFGKLSRAVSEKCRLKVEYFTQSRDELTVRLIDPYHILNHGGDWYLVAYCHLRKAVRDFAISRMRSVEETDELFIVASDFDLESYLRKGFGIEKGGKPMEVAILFDPYQARWIREKSWVEGEVKEEKGDGSLVLRIEVPATGELRRWVLSFGSHAEVLEPRQLREEMKEEARAVLGRYL